MLYAAQLIPSHFQSNRGELEKVLAQRRAKLRSEFQKDSHEKKQDKLLHLEEK